MLQTGNHNGFAKYFYITFIMLTFISAIHSMPPPAGPVSVARRQTGHCRGMAWHHRKIPSRPSAGVPANRAERGSI